MVDRDTRLTPHSMTIPVLSSSKMIFRARLCLVTLCTFFTLGISKGFNVKFVMEASICNLQIAYGVIQRIMVLVMNNLSRPKLPADILLHDVSMFVNRGSVNAYNSVPLSVHKPSLVAWMNPLLVKAKHFAFITTKAPWAVFSEKFTNKLFFTVFTGQRFHMARLSQYRIVAKGEV